MCLIMSYHDFYANVLIKPFIYFSIFQAEKAVIVIQPPSLRNIQVFMFNREYFGRTKQRLLTPAKLT